MKDANADLNDTDWATFMNRGEIYDVLGTKHGYDTPNTYIRGSSTIDHMLATK